MLNMKILQLQDLHVKVKLLVPHLYIAIVKETPPDSSFTLTGQFDFI